jgi:hypothetical protein
LKKLICAAACVVATAALAPAGASALPGAGASSRLVAVGTDGRTLTCATNVHDKRYTGSTYHIVSGSTVCGGAIQQSCELTHIAKNGGQGYYLSGGGFSDTCALGEGEEGEFSSLVYHTVVHAPAGMVWLGVPTQCSGAGTATLDCTFSTGETPV